MAMYCHITKGDNYHKMLKRKLMPHNRICCEGYRKSQILFLIDAAFINAAYVLTSSVFLSGFVIQLKGSDFIVGLLNKGGGRLAPPQLTSNYVDQS